MTKWDSDPSVAEGLAESSRLHKTNFLHHDSEILKVIDYIKRGPKH